ncbi:MAG TPA: aldehyde ferredoxin oxidoreductase C-terminal domain-containing protein, partial [Thermodesulfovibrionales bacterium]|nr:aldehyde ferredoxin oxidoreductase C-terminal domain-containing protein [Thermodesulfovibrionales bacterium]
CIHIGFVRERFAEDNRYLYRQVSYDHEPIFAVGAMLGVLDCFKVLDIIDVVERMGLDVMSAGVALAWATEALEKGIISEAETIVPMRFGYAGGYKEGMLHLAMGTNEFYQVLSRGAMVAAERYNGKDFACVLGQEMAGYATGETFFVGQALGLRHSHLDSSGYSYDQKPGVKDASVAAEFLVRDEQGRVFLTSMLSCLFARGVYTDELLHRCLNSLGYDQLANSIPQVSRNIQKLRWRTKFETGYDPKSVSIPKRFSEVVTWKGKIDTEYMQALKDEYAKKITELGLDGD